MYALIPSSPLPTPLLASTHIAVNILVPSTLTSSQCNILFWRKVCSRVALFLTVLTLGMIWHGDTQLLLTKTTLIFSSELRSALDRLRVLCMGSVSKLTDVCCAWVQLNRAQVHLFENATGEPCPSMAHIDQTSQTNWTFGGQIYPGTVLIASCGVIPKRRFKTYTDYPWVQCK